MDDPFFHPQDCDDGCAGKGLHAHHPRDCFYYTRDIGEDLQKLLELNEIPYETEIAEDREGWFYVYVLCFCLKINSGASENSTNTPSRRN